MTLFEFCDQNAQHRVYYIMRERAKINLNRHAIWFNSKRVLLYLYRYTAYVLFYDTLKLLRYKQTALKLLLREHPKRGHLAYRFIASVLQLHRTLSRWRIGSDEETQSVYVVINGFLLIKFETHLQLFANSELAYQVVIA